MTFTGFLKPYKGLASDEALEKAQTWFLKADKFPIAQKSLRGGSFYRSAEFKKFKSFGPEAYDLILGLDIIRRCLAISNLYFAICTIEITKDLGEDVKAGGQPVAAKLVRTNWAMAGFLWQTTDSLFSLVFKEHDTSARIISRSILEASDYWLAFFHDRDLSIRYCDSEDDFRAFWGTELRPKKISKLRRSALLSFFNGDTKLVDDIEAFHEESLTHFSQAVHASYLAGLWNFVGHRPFHPDTSDWDFLSEWPHRRVCTASIDSTSLILSVVFLCLSANDEKVDFFPRIDGKRFTLAEDGFMALLHGAAFAGSIAANHHVRFPSKTQIGTS